MCFFYYEILRKFRYRDEYRRSYVVKHFINYKPIFWLIMIMMMLNNTLCSSLNRCDLEINFIYFLCTEFVES